MNEIEIFIPLEVRKLTAVAKNVQKFVDKFLAQGLLGKADHKSSYWNWRRVSNSVREKACLVSKLGI